MEELIVSLLGEWVEPFLPSPRLTLLLAPAAFGYVLASSWLAGWLRMEKGVPTPYTRKVFHFCIFTMAGIVQLIWGLPGAVVYGSVVSLRVIYAALRGEGNRFYEAIARPSDAPSRTTFVIIPLITTAAGGILSNLLFTQYAFVGYLVCGWGDAAGEPVGTRWGRHRYTVPSLSGVPATRSLEGSAAVLLVGAVAAAIGLMSAGVGAGTATLAGVACGLAGTLVEAISNHGLDNLTTQVAASGVAYLLLAS